MGDNVYYYYDNNTVGGKGGVVMSDLEKRPQTDEGEIFYIKYSARVREYVSGIDKEKIKEKVFSKTVIKVFAACLIGAMVVSGSTYYYNYENSGYAVKYQGKLLGYVRDKNTAVNAFDELKEELKKYDTSIDIKDELQFDKVLIDASKLQDAKALVQPLAPGFYKQYTSYALVINGTEMACVGSEDEANKVIDTLKKHYEAEEAKSGAQVLNITIKDDIKVVPKVVDNSKLVDAKAVIDKLLAGRGTTKKYEVKSGDSLWRIASNNSMRIEDIQAVNPGLNPDRLQIGQLVNLSVSEPYINVETTIKAVFDEDIPYDTKYQDDGKLYRGQTRVVESGQYGINKVEKQITKLNGKEIASTILSTINAKNPVTRVLARGTKELVGSGRFLWPVNGSITSMFGSRGREYHRGLDIGAPVGTPIVAADSGTVTMAGRYYDYGKLVIIDHGNGFTTYYAHCSTLYVEEGQTVTKGQRIADVGMTGWTTGPHLHFEVRYNGDHENPMRHLN